MNLLPKGLNEFHTKEYWNSFFVKRNQSTFEWYGEYPVLKPFLKAYIMGGSRVLNVGCGNSTIAADLINDHHPLTITSIDFSEVVIDEMTKKHKDISGLRYELMDMTKLAYEDGSFDVVLDKGALDAMYSGDAKEVVDNVTRMMDEAKRVLAPNGTYLCVTLAQHHILSFLLNYWANDCYIRLHEINVNPSDAGALSPFVVSIRKDPTIQGPSKIDAFFLQQGLPKKGWSPDNLLKQVKDVQDFKITRQALKKWNSEGARYTLELWGPSPSPPSPRYSISIIDKKLPSKSQPNSKRKFAGPCAVFIVPQGREHEWVFGTDEGREQLSESANYSRLIVVAMSRLHSYNSLDEVKQELSPKVMELMVPDDCKNSANKIPFLTAAEGLGHRKIVCDKTSPTIGQMVVEEVEVGEGAVERRLVFMNNPRLIQSQILLIPAVVTTHTRGGGGKSKAKKQPAPPPTLPPQPALAAAPANYRVDYSYLGCAYQQAIVVATALFLPALVSPVEAPKGVIIGLGGGSLPMFFNKYIPMVNLEVIELEGEVVAIAREYFGVVESPSLKVTVGDGLQHPLTEDSLTLLIVDADSRDLTKGISCPPLEFLTKDNLYKFKKALKPNGAFLLNLVCRSCTIHDEVMAAIKSMFAEVYETKVAEDEVNTLVVAFPSKRTAPFPLTPKELLEEAKRLEHIITTNNGNDSSWKKRLDFGCFVSKLHSLLQDSK